jgi:hypothetical protein
MTRNGLASPESAFFPFAVLQPYELAYRKAFRALDRLVVAIHVNK